MIKYVRFLAKLRADERAVTAVEYGIMAALIATVLVTAVTSFTGGLTHTFDAVAGHLNSAS